MGDAGVGNAPTGLRFTIRLKRPLSDVSRITSDRWNGSAGSLTPSVSETLTLALLDLELVGTVADGDFDSEPPLSVGEGLAEGEALWLVL